MNQKFDSEEKEFRKKLGNTDTRCLMEMSTQPSFQMSVAVVQVWSVNMCRGTATIKNRTTEDKVDSVSAHTHCGLVLLENGGDVIGFLLLLLRVVLDEWRPVCSPAPGFLGRLA